MAHKVFIRHTYIYKCSDQECGGEWKINESPHLDKLNCPHCGRNQTSPTLKALIDEDKII